MFQMDILLNVRLKISLILILATIIIQGCENKLVSLPEVETISVNDITGTDFKCIGNIISDGGTPITECGFCVDRKPYPTILNTKIIVTNQSGRFESRVNYSFPGSKYYIRSYAITSVGLSYGNQIEIFTDSTLPDCITSNAYAITPWSTIVSGYVSKSGGVDVSETGFVFGNDENPTIKDLKIVCKKNNSSEFQGRLNNLFPGKKYYVRSYAINSKGIGYGNQLDIITLNNNGEQVIDIDGNSYRTVVIGKYIWMAENLRVTKYNDGSLISHITSEKEWKETYEGAYCHYKNSTEKLNEYGVLYNWYAAGNVKKICPDGWHIPNLDEWSFLSDTIVGSNQNSAYIKEAGTIEDGTGHWAKPNINARDFLGFSALPGGMRSSNGLFGNRGYGGHWWCSTVFNENNIASRSLIFSGTYMGLWGVSPRNGFSVRCIKDY